MKRFLRLLLSILLLAGLAAGGYWFYQQRAQRQSATSNNNLTQIVAVKQGDLSASLTVVGQLDAEQNEVLSFDRLRTVASLLTLEVAAGNVVSGGQVLASIDPAPYEQTLDEAKSVLQLSLQTLAELQEPPTELALAQSELAVSKAELDLKQALKAMVEVQEPPDLSDLQAALQNAQDSLALAKLRQSLADHSSQAKSARDLQYAVDWNQRRYWEVKDIIASGTANLEQTEELTTVQEALAELQIDLIRSQAQQNVSVQSAASEVTMAQAAISEAQQNLADAQTGANDLALAETKVAIQKATVAAQIAWETRNELQAGADPTKLALAQADIAQKQQAVVDAKADLAATKLLAPFAGTILQTTAIPGNRITSNSAILTLANLKHLQVVAAVDETTIRQVKSGQSAKITFDAFGGQQFKGEVLSVPLQGTLQGDVMVYEVAVSLLGAEELPLLVGMTANIEIQVGQVKNALLLPKMAILSFNGGYQVLIPNRSDPTGQAQVVSVEVGLSDGIYSEITRGLNAGDPVVVQVETSTTTTFGFPGGGLVGGPGGGGPPPGGGNGGATRRSGG